MLDLFGISKRERELYERIIREKDATITSLADQIDWLRLTQGTPTPLPALNPSNQVPATPMQSGAPYLSEEEEDVLFMREQGLLSLQELEAALEQIGFQGTEIEEYRID